MDASAACCIAPSEAVGIKAPMSIRMQGVVLAPTPQHTFERDMQCTEEQLTRRTALLLVYSHSRQGFSRVKTLKFCPALPSAAGLPPAMRLSFLLGTSAGGGALKSMLHRLEDVCRTADCTCRLNCSLRYTSLIVRGVC